MKANEFAEIIGSPHPSDMAKAFFVSCNIRGVPIWVEDVCYRGMPEIRFTDKRRKARAFEKAWAEKLRDSLYRPSARIEAR